MTPLLFFSHACPHSRRLVASLSESPPPQDSLSFVCVDEQIDSIPSQIDRVPALLVPTPDGNRLLFGSQMYDWINGLCAQKGPEDFVSVSDAFLCDLEGSDGASHLFAGASDDIHIHSMPEESDGPDRRGDPKNIIAKLVEERERELVGVGG